MNRGHPTYRFGWILKKLIKNYIDREFLVVIIYISCNNYEESGRYSTLIMTIINSIMIIVNLDLNQTMKIFS